MEKRSECISKNSPPSRWLETSKGNSRYLGKVGRLGGVTEINIVPGRLPNLVGLAQCGLPKHVLDDQIFKGDRRAVSAIPESLRRQ